MADNINKYMGAIGEPKYGRSTLSASCISSSVIFQQNRMFKHPEISTSVHEDTVDLTGAKLAMKPGFDGNHFFGRFIHLLGFFDQANPHPRSK